MVARRILSTRGRRRQTGQSFIEYVVVTLVAVVALISPLAELGKAIRESYMHYSFAMSVATIPGLDKSECSGSRGAAGVTVTLDACKALEDIVGGQVPGAGSFSTSISITTP